MSVETRFWSKVNRDGSCWRWTGAHTPTGYGKLYVDGRAMPAHRVSWTLTHGPIPEGLCVLHRCDNPPCVNPAHLFLGTLRDNTRDMLAKGRHRAARGEASGRVRMTEAEVRRARQLHDDGMGPRAVARLLGRPYSTVYWALRRVSWNHV